MTATVIPSRRTCRVIRNRPLSPAAYELVVQRDGMPFEPGMLVTIHGPEDPTLDREYSISSRQQDPDELQFLYRVIENGRLTQVLQQLTPGSEIDITGPHGTFVVRDRDRPLVFVATGTGLAPCLSFARSDPDLDLTILHGVRDPADLFYADELARFSYLPCVSGAAQPRRVTDVIRETSYPSDTHFYLCGAYEMIVDVQTILYARGFGPCSVFDEAYYYK